MLSISSMTMMIVLVSLYPALNILDVSKVIEQRISSKLTPVVLDINSPTKIL